MKNMYEYLQLMVAEAPAMLDKLSAVLAKVDPRVKKYSWFTDSSLAQFSEGLSSASEYLESNENKPDLERGYMKPFVKIQYIFRMYKEIHQGTKHRIEWLENPLTKNEWTKVNGLMMRDAKDQDLLDRVRSTVEYGDEILSILEDYFSKTDNENIIL